ncbi:hypothetical protein EDC65_1917 [Stella humosa]|uniref:Uncharacterized protein n=1 Tax=Stella humosa TaxID=94 RepID=A0A3N1M8V1_9PROT|nr:hypothetical protein [Stella humosa]ROQ00121.1 hypothetical protein EDC65_1917 [Stella humosa]BBK30645.1 hypothetical protein STHU_12790 [Stella humosa]
MNRPLQTALRAAAFLVAIASGIGAFAATETRGQAAVAEEAGLMAHFADDVRTLNPVGQAPRADLSFCRGSVVAVSYRVAATPDQVRRLHEAAMRKYGAPIAAPIAISHGAVAPLVYRMGDVSLTVESTIDEVMTHHRRRSACTLRAS